MLRRFFDRITRGSLRVRWLTVALSVLVLAAGVFALTQFNQELIPSVEFPQSVVLAFYNGADIDAVVDEVTIPIEDAVRAVDGVVYVESSSGPGYAAVIISTEYGLDQEALRDEIRSAVGAIQFPEEVEAPELLAFSLSDLPLSYVSVSSSQLSLRELKDLVESHIVPKIEAIPEVARVNVSGGQELPSEAPGMAQSSLAEVADEPTAVPTATPTAEPTPTDTPPTVTPAASSPAATETGASLEPDVEPVALPDSWIQAAAAQSFQLETTADLTPDMVAAISSMAPQMLAELTPEMLLAMPLDALKALPADYLDGLDPDLRKQLVKRLESPIPGQAVEEPDDSPPLPDSWIAMAEAADTQLPFEFRTAADLQNNGLGFGVAQLLNLMVSSGMVPDPGALLQALEPTHILWWAEQDPTFLESLAPETIRLLAPETQAVLPAELLTQLEADESTGDAPAVEGPPLPPSWAGPDSPFQTSADLLDNPFGMPPGQLLNMVVGSNPESLAELTPEVILWLADQDPDFLADLEPDTLRLFSADVLTSLPPDYLASLAPDLQDELAALAAGTATAFLPTETINRTNGQPSLTVTIYKNSEANTVAVSHKVFDLLDRMEQDFDGLRIDVAFEQASFIEESIGGVAREGGLGALFAVVVILLFLSGFVNGRYSLSWRSTLVTAVSIPLSVLMGFALMRWLPPAGHALLAPLAETTKDVAVVGPIVEFLLKLFPAAITINIMTLSGMTVAVGRVVDDSIVVLENIYRHIQRGEDPRQSVIAGTRDVAIPIFASTVTTVVVFLPIGLMGGLIGNFFLPFGMTVTYALISSFLVAITIVPVLAFLFIRRQHLPPVQEQTALQRAYTPILRWALGNRLLTLSAAAVIFAGSLWLLAQRPQTFLPDLGEQTINVTADLPNGTTMAETDQLVRQFEAELATMDGLHVYQTEIGSAGGMEAALFSSAIDQSIANLTISVESMAELDQLTGAIRQEAETVFGADSVTVSAGGLTAGGMSGFDLVVSGDPQVLAQLNNDILQALQAVNGLVNVTSNLADGGAIVRVNGQPAVRYEGEIESEDTMGVLAAGKAAVEGLPGLPDGINVSEGFVAQIQTEGFAQASQALVISIIVVYLVMVAALGSLAHPFVILFSLPLAVVGAALGLWITGKVVGISAIVGLMMLVGIVVTNAIVLIDRVHMNRQERHMGIYEALVEAGRTRLRPILMTAVAAILALVPLALGMTEGALIASDLAVVVIGGLLTSTLLTLVVVPVVYSLVESALGRLRKNRTG
jgi:HAE1 family hydrophobic/amphiphilic exporter-1